MGPSDQSLFILRTVWRIILWPNGWFEITPHASVSSQQTCWTVNKRQPAEPTLWWRKWLRRTPETWLARFVEVRKSVSVFVWQLKVGKRVNICGESGEIQENCDLGRDRRGEWKRGISRGKSGGFFLMTWREGSWELEDLSPAELEKSPTGTSGYVCRTKKNGSTLSSSTSENKCWVPASVSSVVKTISAQLLQPSSKALTFISQHDPFSKSRATPIILSSAPTDSQGPPRAVYSHAERLVKVKPAAAPTVCGWGEKPGRRGSVFPTQVVVFSPRRAAPIHSW